MRNLASKSAEAAKNTGALITSSIAKADMGTRIADQTAESFAYIVTGINESGRLFEEIAKATKNQSVSIDQINVSIDQVSHVVQQNSATAEQSAASCAEMNAQFDMLTEVVSHFKLNKKSLPGNRRIGLPPKER